ncbi:acyltransferase, ws/dgat/mgat [Alcanivorax balearicus MACL04]|uniref:diacylglycerol O-acyltransferase n=1 Tax=Alloalcanivorax balearicus MACL04 TaxID=1177182 RepID=A0ABT2R4J5_9GAMM|nr:wax ester/triacylglycerol synthase family O-acyltransferase [Alloalcanivorax balearicus]MCU5784702.1 acyltransferase, ws/dgat/mgat [Alloalcanivorax balearicus MACL04]
MEHLSSIDASFLHLETPETPMHVASLALVDAPEGDITDFLNRVKKLIGDRMHLSGVLTRKLAPMPFELAEPVWIEDHDIDLDYHIRHMTVRKPGSMREFDELIGRLHSMLLDRSRPLWEIYVIDGLESGQVGIYAKLHHSGIDGKAGMEFAKVLYDTTEEPRTVIPPRRSRGGAYQLGFAELLRAGFTNASHQYRKLAGMMPVTANLWGKAANIMASQSMKSGERPLNLGMAPRTIFNESITNQRSFARLTLSMDEVKALGKRAGGTINTVIMTMCSEALRGFLKDRGLLPKESLIAMVPASLRSADDDTMNNQVTMIRVDLATDIEDLRERFHAIHDSSEAGKSVVRELKEVLAVDFPVMGAPWFMTGLASLIGRSRLLNQMPAVGNVLISNVPGPPVPLYIAGARMQHYYPVSIPYHGSGLNITLHSYAGQLEFGITACRRMLPQDEAYELLDRLEQALRKIEALPEEAAAAEASAREARVDEPVPVKKKARAKTSTASKAPRRRKAATGKPSSAS